MATLVAAQESSSYASDANSNMEGFGVKQGHKKSWKTATTTFTFDDDCESFVSEANINLFSSTDNFSISDLSERLDKIPSKGHSGRFTLGDARAPNWDQSLNEDFLKKFSFVDPANISTLKGNKVSEAVLSVDKSLDSAKGKAASDTCDGQETAGDRNTVSRTASEKWNTPKRGVGFTRSADNFHLPRHPSMRTKRVVSKDNRRPFMARPCPRRGSLDPKKTIYCHRPRRFDSLGSSSHHSWCSGISSLGMDSSIRSDISFASLPRAPSGESSFLPSVDTVLHGVGDLSHCDAMPRRPSRSRSPDAMPRRPVRCPSPTM